jgi:hypothetical protein
VWIKLSAATDGDFVQLTSRACSSAANLAATACFTLGWDRVAPCHMGLYLVAEGGSDAPEPAAIEAALSRERIPAAAPVTPGTWLVARPINVTASKQHSSDSAGSINPRSSGVTLQGSASKAEACMAFLALVHSAFPNAALETVRTGLLHAVEADCLLKIPALTSCNWMQEPAAPFATFLIGPASKATFPPCKGSPVQAVQSNLSLVHSPVFSAMYILGEVYSPLGGEDALEKPAQKLLQAERTLQFLVAKEGRPVLECILGVVFLGPHMTVKMGAAVFLTLQHYKVKLPCLWALQGEGRVLGHLARIQHASVHAAVTTAACERLERLVHQQLLQQCRCTVM